jgi:hypothetical protein
MRFPISWQSAEIESGFFGLSTRSFFGRPSKINDLIDSHLFGADMPLEAPN